MKSSRTAGTRVPETDDETDLALDSAADGNVRYRAPALEKGLDILELVAASPQAMTVAEIARRLGRSKGELFRMIQVLEWRGYVARSEGGDGYRTTDKLFAMGMSQPQVRGLVELAIPVMRELSQACGQSCHLALFSQGQIVVVARMESSEQLGFSVRVGYRRSILATASGATLFAHQGETTRQRWLQQAADSAQAGANELDAFLKLAQKAQRLGHLVVPSSFVTGVTDLSAPIMRGDVAAAALTIPFVKSSDPKMDMDRSLEQLRSAAAALAAQLLVNDGRI